VCVRPCDCEVDCSFVSYISIIASHLETVMRCVESQIRIISRMRLIVNECEMCESHDTFVGIDLHFLTKVDLRFLLIVDGNTVYVTSLQFSSKCVIESCNCL